MSDPIDRLAAEPPPIAPPLSTALEHELAALAPVSPRRPLRQLAIVIAIALVYGAGLVAALEMRRDMRELPIGFVVGAGIGWLLGFAVPSYLALVPRAGAVVPRPSWALASALVASIGFVTLGLLVHPSGPSSGAFGAEHLTRGHWCLEIGLAAAFVPVLIGAVFLRGALPVGSRSVAAALGAGGGSLGGLVLHLHCHVADALHVGLVHGGVVVIAALLSAALVPRAT